MYDTCGFTGFRCVGFGLCLGLRRAYKRYERLLKGFEGSGVFAGFCNEFHQVVGRLFSETRNKRMKIGGLAGLSGFRAQRFGLTKSSLLFALLTTTQLSCASPLAKWALLAWSKGTQSGTCYRLVSPCPTGREELPLKLPLNPNWGPHKVGWRWVGLRIPSIRPLILGITPPTFIPKP